MLYMHNIHNIYKIYNVCYIYIIYYVCSEMPFGAGLCLVEASRLVCVVGWLTGFFMIWFLWRVFFRTDFLIVLISFIYLSLIYYINIVCPYEICEFI